VRETIETTHSTMATINRTIHLVPGKR